jgi:hypothetical protein
MSINQPGLQADGGAVANVRLGRGLGFGQDVGKIIPDIRDIGRNLDRSPVVIDRLVPAPEITQCRRQIVVDLRRTRTQRSSVLIRLHRVVMATEPAIGVPKAVVMWREIGFERHRLPD